MSNTRDKTSEELEKKSFFSNSKPTVDTKEVPGYVCEIHGKQTHSRGCVLDEE